MRVTKAPLFCANILHPNVSVPRILLQKCTILQYRDKPFLTVSGGLPKVREYTGSTKRSLDQFGMRSRAWVNIVRHLAICFGLGTLCSHYLAEPNLLTSRGIFCLQSELVSLHPSCSQHCIVPSCTESKAFGVFSLIWKYSSESNFELWASAPSSSPSNSSSSPTQILQALKSYPNISSSLFWTLRNDGNRSKMSFYCQ